MKESKLSKNSSPSIFSTQNLLPIVKVNIALWLLFYFSFILIIPLFFYATIALYFKRKQKRINEVIATLNVNLQKQQTVFHVISNNLSDHALEQLNLPRPKTLVNDLIIPLDQINFQLTKNNLVQKKLLKELLNSNINVDHELQKHIHHLNSLKATNLINQNLYNVYAQDLNEKIFSWPSSLIAYLMALAPLPIYLD